MTSETVKPADAALLREEASIIDGWVERARFAFAVVPNLDAARTRAARLRALAEVLEKISFADAPFVRACGHVMRREAKCQKIADYLSALSP